MLVTNILAVMVGYAFMIVKEAEKPADLNTNMLTSLRNLKARVRQTGKCFQNKNKNAVLVLIVLEIIGNGMSFP